MMFCTCIALPPSVTQNYHTQNTTTILPAQRKELTAALDGCLCSKKEMEVGCICIVLLFCKAAAWRQPG
jgi:hypothetical protein